MFVLKRCISLTLKITLKYSHFICQLSITPIKIQISIDKSAFMGEVSPPGVSIFVYPLFYGPAHAVTFLCLQ